MNKKLLSELNKIKGKPIKFNYTKEHDEVILLSRTPEYSITYPNLSKFFKEHFGVDRSVMALKERYYKLKSEGK